MKTALLSNVNVDSLARRLGKDHDIHIADGFGTWAQELINPDSDTWRQAPSVVAVLIDGAELLRSRNPLTDDDRFDRLSQAQSIVSSAAEAHPGVTFLVSTLDIPQEGIATLADFGPERFFEADWLSGLRTLATQRPNLLVWDVKRLVEAIGRDRFYSAKRQYFGGLRYSIDGEKTLAEDLRQMLRAYRGMRKKCLVLDLDNTLWGGVVGEDGPEGISLDDVGPGARYKDFQRRLKELKELGVILVIASKNNHADALDVIRSHPHMVLQEDDFAAMKIDWAPKAQNIAALAETLNIGTDSLVFIDDSPVERGSVTAALPEVTVPEFPDDTAELPAFLQGIYRQHFLFLSLTQEDRQKTKMLLQNARRAEAQTLAGSAEDFLRALETTIEIGAITDRDVSRAAQLTQKTNQFNLTTRRYTEADLNQMRHRGNSLILLANVSDRFGDSGKCCLAIVERDGAHARLDSFLMSCRVMGRHVEDEILAHLIARLREMGVEKLTIEIRPTDKNTPARTWVQRTFGLEDDSGRETRTCTIDPSRFQVPCLGFATVIDTGQTKAA